MYDIACIVEEGIGRKGNDDRAMVCGHLVETGEYQINTECIMAVVCDGVGGEAFGSEAAQLAVEHFSSLIEASFDERYIETQIEIANDKIVEMQNSERKYRNMATTIAGICIEDSILIVFNVGDSKVYRYRSPYIAKLSTDHTLVSELHELGLEVGAESAHVITRCLGGESHRPYIEKLLCRETDAFIICSDGITDVIDDLEMELIMSENANSIETCRMLVEKAMSRETQDNISVIVIRRK